MLKLPLINNIYHHEYLTTTPIYRSHRYYVMCCQLHFDFTCNNIIRSFK